jgi:hypothetical protein
MVLLVTLHLELRFASGGTEFELFKNSAIRSRETSIFLCWARRGGLRDAI